MRPPYNPKLFFVQLSLIILVLLPLTAVGVASAGAEEFTLTGTVKRPTPPHSPAEVSTVKLFEKGIEIGKDTTDTGTYTFKVARGETVVVRASWRSAESMPGWSKLVKVVADPTVADVQLLPPKGASAADWLESGKLIAKTGGETVMLVPETLQQAQVPAASIFQFVRGARTESSESFKGLVNITMFNSKDWPVVAEGLQQAEQQYKAKGTVPNYQELGAKLKDWGPLTVQQHAEIIGFIAPRHDEDASKRWEDAVEQSLGPKIKMQIIAKKVILDAHVFAVREKGTRAKHF